MKDQQFSSTEVSEVSIEHCAEVVEGMNIHHTLDLGAAIIQSGEHPSLGLLHVVSTIAGKAAVLVAG